MNKKYWLMLFSVVLVTFYGFAGARQTHRLREREARNAERQAKAAAFKAIVKQLGRYESTSVARLQQKLELVTEWNTFIVFEPYVDARCFEQAGIKSRSVRESLEMDALSVENWWVAALDENGDLVGSQPMQYRFKPEPDESVIVLRRGAQSGK